MKGKIIVFIIGLLLGAILSTGSIYFYTVAVDNSNQNNMQAPNGMGNNAGNMNQDGTTPPDMPSNNNSNSNSSSNAQTNS